MPGFKRGTGFSQVEIDHMLEIVWEILPISTMEWDCVEKEHSMKWPVENHTKESLK